MGTMYFHVLYSVLTFWEYKVCINMNERLGNILRTEIGKSSIRKRAWIINCIHLQQWDVINLPITQRQQRFNRTTFDKRARMFNYKLIGNWWTGLDCWPFGFAFSQLSTQKCIVGNWQNISMVILVRNEITQEAWRASKQKRTSSIFFIVLSR